MTYLAPQVAEHWEYLLERLTPAERAVLPFAYDIWLRPEQQVTLGPWRTRGTIAGRGFGKSHGYGAFMNGLALAGHGQTENGFGLCATNERVVHEVQVDALINTAPPWNRPEVSNGRLWWPNGARASFFTAEAPDSIRGRNVEVSWCTELVAWGRTTARRTWEEIELVTRVGLAKIVFDTTSQGRCPVILDRVSDHQSSPDRYLLIRGTSYDNVLLPQSYFDAIDKLYPNKQSRRYQEEILGRVFAEASGALWQEEWIEAGRREIAPALEIVVVALDPARSEREDADEFGLVIAGRAPDAHIYVLEDHSGHMSNRRAAELIVDRCEKDAAGLVWEANNTGQAVIELVQMVAEQRGLVLHPIPDGKPFPKRVLGRIYTRKVTTFRSKEARADAPAGLYADGRVHHVGNLSRLEEELTTWEPGDGKSPNRLDALVYAVSELADVGIYQRRAPAADAKAAAQASAIMRQAFERAAAQKRIGL